MKVEDLFEVEYGTNLELNHLKKVSSAGINFVSRTRKNNGVSAIVERLNSIEPLPEGLITVATSGTVMESFVQPFPFYSGRDVYYLKPKKDMGLNLKLFYCMCLKRNKFKYSYGRQANRTLKSLELPDEIPLWVKKFNTLMFDNINKPFSNKKLDLSSKKWELFSYADVFDVERGFYNKRPEIVGDINFISASMFNNGITDRVALEIIERMYKGNCLTVVNNGHAGEAFYQKEDFTCSHDVNILRPKETDMNVYKAMFLIPIIRKEKYRFNYGRKWRYERMLKSKIKLPINDKGKPDWDFMESYVKGLNYSKEITAFNT